MPKRVPQDAGKKPERANCERLILILGDQLDRNSAALDGFVAGRDRIVMIEATGESEHVPSHMQRTVLFLASMRHHATWLEENGFGPVRYVKLVEDGHSGALDGELARALRDVKPRSLCVVEPGEHRVKGMIQRVCDNAKVSAEWCEDRHFISTPKDFAAWAEGRKTLTMEYWYRHQRERLGILIEKGGEPVGGTWNLDAENRQSFGKGGPDPKPTPLPSAKKGDPAGWAWDGITQDVVRDVRSKLRLPGELSEGRLQWPVTHEQAAEALNHFIDHHLRHFGPYEDAMWSGEPFLYHSLLSSSLNLKLLDPRACVNAAIVAYKKGRAPLQSVEAFIRQIIGWREFIRGIYYLEGPEYELMNALNHTGNLPPCYWTGDVEMKCLRECIGSVVKHGFAHHIARLMVMGNFALLAGVHPKQVSDWFLGMFVDGVDWVTLPNALGMSQHGDGGIVGTKPYICGGAYIKKMSNFCSGCKYDPSKRTGEKACPFTTMYWDFLMRHRPTLAKNQRVNKVLGNIDRFSEEERVEIRITAERIRKQHGVSGSRSSPGWKPQ
ncbi:MAG: cryptochrome/photolyase family protein [Planctomycetes bacterium]|nr:cryptochrome/photolyase family protein [Planctomycetota bacterium]